VYGSNVYPSPPTMSTMNPAIISIPCMASLSRTLMKANSLYNLMCSYFGARALFVVVGVKFYPEGLESVTTVVSTNKGWFHGQKAYSH
jgi:hypothetical protein